MRFKITTLKLLAIHGFILISQVIMAQDSIVKSGIYVTLDDFKNNHLIEESACTKDHGEFKKHDMFNRDHFDVIIKGVKKTFKKSSIYAYRDCNNKLWRFYDNREFELIEQKNICIYKISKVVMNGLTIEKDPIYYFSKGLSGEIKELSIDNIKKAYSNNKTFCNLIDSEFSNDDLNRAIHRYDFTNKMYRVNYLLIQSESK